MSDPKHARQVNNKDTLLEVIVSELMISPAFIEFLTKKIASDNRLLTQIIDRIDDELLADRIAVQLFNKAHSSNLTARGVLQHILRLSSEKVSQQAADNIYREIRNA